MGVRGIENLHPDDRRRIRPRDIVKKDNKRGAEKASPKPADSRKKENDKDG